MLGPKTCAVGGVSCPVSCDLHLMSCVLHFLENFLQKFFILALTGWGIGVMLWLTVRPRREKIDNPCALESGEQRSGLMLSFSQRERPCADAAKPARRPPGHIKDSSESTVFYCVCRHLVPRWPCEHGRCSPNQLGSKIRQSHPVGLSLRRGDWLNMVPCRWGSYKRQVSKKVCKNATVSMLNTFGRGGIKTLTKHLSVVAPWWPSVWWVEITRICGTLRRRRPMA
jgi:hypothetical protein